MTARGGYRPARALSGRDRGGIRYLIGPRRHDAPARSTPSRRHRVCCPLSPAPGTLHPAARSLATPPAGSHSRPCTRLGSTIFEPRFASLSAAKTGQVARPATALTILLDREPEAVRATNESQRYQPSPDPARPARNVRPGQGPRPTQSDGDRHPNRSELP